MLEKILEKLNKEYELEKIEDQRFSSFEMTGMDFETQGFYIKGLGHVGFMKASGMGGAMKMETLVIDPLEIDAPLLSSDRIVAGGKDMVIFELYDTLLQKEIDTKDFEDICSKYEGLSDMPMQSRWYDELQLKGTLAKSVGLEESDKVDALEDEYSDAFLKLLKTAVPCSKEEKKEKARAYSHRLIEEGGTSTDNFIKNWGKDKTREFFDTILFG